MNNNTTMTILRQTAIASCRVGQETLRNSPTVSREETLDSVLFLRILSCQPS